MCGLGSFQLFIWKYYSFSSFRYKLKYMVRKQARPPTTLEMGSAMKTPFTPNPIEGSIKVSGTTMTTLRKMEKKIARFAQPSDWKTICPANCSDMKTKPKKYRCSAGTAAVIISGSDVNSETRYRDVSRTNPQAAAV